MLNIVEIEEVLPLEKCPDKNAKLTFSIKIAKISDLFEANEMDRYTPRSSHSYVV
jgi:hypothetical protein